MPTTYQPLLRAPYICRNCLSRPFKPAVSIPQRHAQPLSSNPHRRNETSAAASTPLTPPAQPGPPPSGYAELTNRSIISISGIDAPKFLQGLTTNNVDPARQEGWYTAFLNATGRVLWDAFVYPRGKEGGGYLIEVDRAEVGVLVRHLSRHKLRSKVVIGDEKEEWRVWGLWGGNGMQPSDAKYSDALPSADQIAMLDPRLPALGHRVVLSERIGTPSQAFSRYEELAETDLSSYTVRRYLAGVPEGQAEILRETALPLECNMDYLNGIDFRKGCYVGQELTIRTQHTGVVRKRILPVQLYASAGAPTELVYDATDPVAEIAIETPTDVKSDGGKRPTGKLLARVGNIGLALCRLENMTDMRVSAEGGNYDEKVGFSVAAGSEGERVKLKAFVPEWLREREREKMERRSKKSEEELVD